MANYDASVRVNTKVDNSDLGKLQKDFDKLEAKLDSLYKKGDKLEALGVDKQSRQWQALRYDVAQTEIALEDVKDRIQEVNRVNISDSDSGFKRLEKTSKKCLDTIQKGTKKSNGLLSTLGSRLRGIALSLLIFNWITKGFNAMVSAMKEGFHNLAQYSDEYNQSMSALKSQTEQLKNSLATAFEPIVNMAIPYITKLVEWLNIAADSMAQFFAAIQGKSTYTRAKKQVIDYAKSLDTASKSAKRALASFDELNVLNKEGGSASGGALTGADAFEEAEINPEIYEMLEKVKKLLEIIKPLAVAIGVVFLAWKLARILNDLGTLSTSLYNAYGIILLIAGLALSVYKYLNMWKNGVDWEGIIGYISGVSMAVLGLYMLFGPLAAGIGLIVFSIAGLVLAFKDMTENGFTAENMMLALISAVGLVIGVFIVFGATAGIVVGAVMAVIGIFAAMIIWAGNGEEALERLKSMFSKFGSFIKNVFAGDWEAAFEDISGAAIESFNLSNIITESFVNGFIKAINKIIDALNKLKRNLPDWVPDWLSGFGGEDIPNISWKLSIPRYAKGGVIQGGKPFAAILGDQPAGQTNIETPLATMVDAFKQAMSETGGAGGSYTFVAQLEGRTIFSETVRQDQMQYKATGRSAFQH